MRYLAHDEIIFLLDEQQRIVAYLDGLQVKVNALRESQSASGEELSALMPSVLDKSFKGELG
jgi:type I restriction enzyme S subunit